LIIEDSAGGGLTVSGRLGPLPGLAMASHVLLAARAAGQPVLVLLPLSPGQVAPLVPSGWRAASWGAAELDRHPVAVELVLARGQAGAEATAEVMSWMR